MSLLKILDSTQRRWNIENFSLQKGRLESPHSYSFEAELYIEILLKDMCLSRDQIKINLCQLTDFKVQANMSCAFLNSKGSILNFSEKKGATSNEKSGSVCTWILNYEDICNPSKLPDDILTVESRIWHGSDAYGLLGNALFQASFFPQIDVKQYEVVTTKLFIITLEKFGIGKTVKYVEPMLRDKVLTIKLYREVNHRMKVILQMPTSTVTSKYKIHLYTDSKKYVQFKEDHFESDDTSYIFYLDFTSSQEIESFSYNGYGEKFKFLFSCLFYDNTMVDVFANNSNPNAIPNRKRKMCTRAISDKSKCRQPPPLETHNTFPQDLRSMYEEGFLSDFSLRAQDRTFPVHKAILGARSSVFRAMFTADMKERESGSVDIPDVDADTIQRMLEFVYFDSVQEDMQWEGACSLYSAADKYVLKALKQICSSHLIANLSATSVIGVLLLSDTHQDQVLKAAVLDFISRNDKDIVGTERWRNFMEEHGSLALEILQQLYMQKMAV